MRTFVVAATLTAATLALTACGGGDDKPSTAPGVKAQGVEKMMSAYGYSADATAAAPVRVVDILKMLTARLKAQQAKGSPFLVGAEVTAADSNIMHVTMHDDAVSTVSLHLTIQVDSRKHLAQVIRAIRHVPQVQKIVRVKG